ncbi:tetratricopeptide repeat protein [Vibrio sp. V27_P1S3P104]|uniref:tetratricopeptide repeat protein n=1 Tax=unclassified Vibrio TaxID=2614977 RepID=UPI00137234EF|nr:MULTISPECIES: tetratricopeptide repeat protein [unclassified Vibrio]NAW69197.1 tetratricopeptide repeat protein [Vibrio sp. V28_P6S34P95]NAX05396.1 tetratricopeptide repeat protein [Vibrio sp. V30_P3S12P165]NAX34907.1 tetratricopeptide repeat protein [Vibrio sp. V29_P1S30P107]NAX37154.1 tetratricopeptide repeat protein [Vibrio sp. V27_P1S3P104]NAX39462.1 tetratricopeptide repeat protein [Vibrio sp. V26_P1S5P106]
MNWKHSLLALGLAVSLPCVSFEVDDYQTYQRLQMQLQKDPLTTLSAIERFVQQVQSSDQQSQQMAAHLQLQACVALNRYDCAAVAVESLLRLNQDKARKPELLNLSAQLHYQTQSYNTVIERVDNWFVAMQAIEENASAIQSAELYSLKAYSLFHRQAYRDAAKAMERAVEYQNTEQRERFLLALYQQQGDWHNANRVLRWLVSQYAENAEYWEKYAYSFLKLDQEKQAVNALGSAYKANRLPQQSMMLYAQLLLRFHAPDRAIQVLEQHPQLSDHPRYQPLLTQSYLLARDKVKAAEWLAKSEKKDTYALQGLLAYQQGNWQQAADLFKRLEASHENNHYWLLLAAISEFELKRWDSARDSFQRLAGTRYHELATQWLSQIDYLTRE